MSDRDEGAVAAFHRRGFVLLEEPLLPPGLLSHFERSQRALLGRWRACAATMPRDLTGGRLTPHIGERSYAVMFLEVRAALGCRMAVLGSCFVWWLVSGGCAGGVAELSLTFSRLCFVW